jgi:hypothetical protein
MFTLLEVLLKLVLLSEIDYDRSVCQQSLMKILLCIGLLLLESQDLLILAQQSCFPNTRDPASHLYKYCNKDGRR